MHKQIQIAPGVYITDFRKDNNLIGFTQQRKQLTNDVGLLLDQVRQLENKILQLDYSIKQLQAQQNWQDDKDFIEAIEENWQCIVRFSYQMKEKVLRLFQLQYHPQSEKIQQLLKISRIQEREERAIEQVKKNIQSLKNKIEQEKLQKQLVQVSSDEQENKKNSGKQKKIEQQKQQILPSQDDDKGVFI